MDQQILHGVTHPGPLGLGVKRNPHGLIQIGRRIHIGVAQARKVLDDRNRGLLGHRPNEFLSAARNNHIHKAVLLQQDADRLAVSGAHELNRSGRQSSLAERGGQNINDGAVGPKRLGAALENNRVAGLEPQAGGVCRHIRTRFIDNPHHTQRHSDLTDLQAVGPPPHRHCLANRVGQIDNNLQTFRHALNALLGQRQTIQHGRRQAVAAAGLNVLGVGGQECLALPSQCGRRFEQGLVLGLA